MGQRWTGGEGAAPISIDLASAATLQSQIVDQLRALICDRRLRAGGAVPTSRDLSLQLGVSRNTITSAYEILIGEGYLYTERAVGTLSLHDAPGRVAALARYRLGAAHRQP
jgi:GntR family transcriptional regulator/MocR family aminotransferase